MFEAESVALEKAESEDLLCRAEALQKVPGNPYKVTTRSRGKYTSFLVAAHPSPMNSRICGIDTNDKTLPNKMLADFKNAGIAINLPVIGKPAEIKSKAAKFGAEPLRGWTHGQFVADIDQLPNMQIKHKARKLKKDMQDFANIHGKAFGTAESAKPMALEMFKGLLRTRRVEAYAVDIDGQPAAIGLTYFAKNKIAYLATAATSKYARKNGAHQALIAARIKAARERGYAQILSTALLSSQSRRNLENAGLSLSHVQTILTIR